jgi:hypothetical protein
MIEPQLQRDYKLKHMRSSIYNLLPTYNDNSDLESIAKYTRNNSIENETEILHRILCQIMKKECILVEIKRSEFLHYIPPTKYKTIDEVLVQTQKEFQRYQGLIQGYAIEDIQWIVETHNSKIFKLKQGQYVMYNSISERAVSDKYLLWFLEKMTSHIQKFIDPSLKYNVKQKFCKSSEDMIIYILYVFTPITTRHSTDMTTPVVL